MNILDAAYQTVHDYPGGSESLAPRIGMSAAVLRNKVNPNNTTHKLTLEEAESIVDVTGDERMLQSWATSCGKVLLDAENNADAARPLLDFVLTAQAKEGQLSQVLQEALSDGVISQNEFRAISSIAFGAQAAIMQLVNRLRTASSFGVRA